MSWSELHDWWLTELAGDAAYDQVVTPLLLEALRPSPPARYLDIGSGEGRVMRAVATTGVDVVGIEMNYVLAARSGGMSIVADVAAIPAVPDFFDGAYAVLVLEHLQDHQRFFNGVTDMVKPDGVLVIVSNHPMWTAPESSPVEDDAGEVLWRPGEYFGQGSTDMAVAGGVVRFFHRTMAAILNAAADAGWALEEMIEQPHHSLEGQGGIPRLLACRWRLLP